MTPAGWERHSLTSTFLASAQPATCTAAMVPHCKAWSIFSLFPLRGHSGHSSMFWKVSPFSPGLIRPLKKRKKQLYSASELLVPILHPFSDSHLCPQSPQPGVWSSAKTGAHKNHCRIWGWLFYNLSQLLRRRSLLTSLLSSCPQTSGVERCILHPDTPPVCLHSQVHTCFNLNLSSRKEYVCTLLLQIKVNLNLKPLPVLKGTVYPSHKLHPSV